MKTEEILAKFDERTQELAEALRILLKKELNGILELPDQSVNIIGYGYGPGYRDLICTILLSGNGVKLGFNEGATLPDHTKLLTGTGKVHRYVPIKNLSDIRNPELKRLIRAGFDAWKIRNK